MGTFLRRRWLTEQRNQLVHNSAVFLIIFQHRLKGKNTDVFVSWETMWALGTWKSKKKEKKGELEWIVLVSKVIHLSVLKRKAEILSVTLLTT